MTSDSLDAKPLHVIALVVAAVIALTNAAATPARAFGLIDLCPAPCPVYDPAKAAKYLDEAQSAWQQVRQCQEIAKQYSDMLNTFGPSGPLAMELRRVPGNVSGVFATFKTALPGMLKSDDLTDPRAVAEILKTSLFDPSGQEVVKLSDRAASGAQKSELVTAEFLGALAEGFHAYARLVDVAVDGGRQTVLASQATNTRSDLAANISARQAMVDNLGGTQQLLSSWAAAEALDSATVNTETLGKVPAVTAPSSPLAAGLAAKADTLNALRQTRATVNKMDTTISALTSLHNERRAANVMVAQYPGLRNTVDSHNAAIGFRDAEAATASGLLGQVFVDGHAAFQAVTARLLRLDTTCWTDNATKNAAAVAAARAVTDSIQTDAAGFGSPLNPGSTSDLQGEGWRDFVDSLNNSLAAWLEDDKLERFWRPLGHDAERAIGRLDQRLAEIAGRRGFDVTSNAASAEEAALLALFQKQIQQLSTADSQGFSDSQKTTVAAMVGVLQKAAFGVQADPEAKAFVTVAWPQ